jgi:hypothetical protein
VGQEELSMKSRSSTETADLSGRLRDLEHFTGASVARNGPEAEVIPINEAPATHVPVPRRSRVFLRSGGGHGVFAELTLTAPRPSLD